MLINDIIQILLIPLMVFSFLAFVGGLALAIFRHFKRAHYMKNFTEYRAILEYNMEKAYSMIHKEHILTYSLDAYRIDDEDYDKISKEFVLLVSKLCGPVLLREFIFLYGGIDNYNFNLLEYFSSQYENDEIRSTALEQITESDIDDQIPGLSDTTTPTQ